MFEEVAVLDASKDDTKQYLSPLTKVSRCSSFTSPKYVVRRINSPAAGLVQPRTADS